MMALLKGRFLLTVFASLFLILFTAQKQQFQRQSSFLNTNSTRILSQKFFFVIVLILVLLFISCETDKTPVSLKDVSFNENIFNKQWKLVAVKSIDGNIVSVPGPSRTYSVLFDKKGKVKGIEACNNCYGPYELIGDNKISIHMSCTEIACAVPSLGYGDALSHTTRYEIKSESLYIFFTNRGGEEQILVHRLNE